LIRFVVSLPQALLLLVLAAALPSVGWGLTRHVFTEPRMGTLMRITLYAESPDEAEAAARAAFDRIQELDQAMSDYRPDSELNQLMAQPQGTKVRLSDDLYAALRQAEEFAERTGGAFDITMGPLVQLWRETRHRGQLPDAVAVAAAREAVGYRKLVMHHDEQAAELKVAGMRLDLGGIGKGMAADAALEVLRQRGVRRALVAAAGDIAAGDPPPGAEGWRVGMTAGPGPVERIESLSNRAISTSGDAEQFVVIKGVRYSHIVDPRDGLGLRGSRAVTVIAPNATTADALATALSVLGPERGKELLTNWPGVEAVWGEETAPAGRSQETLDGRE
jgi:FAD:protein FMN transferase